MDNPEPRTRDAEPRTPASNHRPHPSDAGADDRHAGGPPAEAPRRQRPESDPGSGRLGHAQDAGHPGGLQPLEDKTETEGEHE